MTRKRSNRKKTPRRSANENPPSPIVLWLHALAAIGDERWEEAMGALRQFLETDDAAQSRSIAYINLGACHTALEQYDEALAMLDAAAQDAPDNVDIAYNRGIIYACAGRMQEAIAAFEAFSRRWPREARKLDIRSVLKKLQRIVREKLPPGDYLVDHLQVQVTHNIELGDFHLVERKGRRMIDANPARPEGHFALGVACLNQGRYAEALDAFIAAFECDPDYAITHYDIGYTYLKMDEPEQAIPWLERALDGDPQYISTLHQLGVAYEQLGQRDEALTWWRRALELAPDDYLTQQRLHEIGMGPAPSEPPLPANFAQMKRMAPLVRARMARPRVYRNGGQTLTYDQFSFILEDEENPRNGTVYSGIPFHANVITASDIPHVLDIMGMVKMLLRMINATNTRSIALLAYYQDRPIFGYQAQFEKGEMVNFDADGQFVVTEAPRFFKLNIDSDLSSPYGDPMQGIMIYLNRGKHPGILLSTLNPQE
mgnify:CR=1 FL=1